MRWKLVFGLLFWLFWLFWFSWFSNADTTWQIYRPVTASSTICASQSLFVVSKPLVLDSIVMTTDLTWWDQVLLYSWSSFLYTWQIQWDNLTVSFSWAWQLINWHYLINLLRIASKASSRQEIWRWNYTSWNYGFYIMWGRQSTTCSWLSLPDWWSSTLINNYFYDFRTINLKYLTPKSIDWISIHSNLWTDTFTGQNVYLEGSYDYIKIDSWTDVRYVHSDYVWAFTGVNIHWKSALNWWTRTDFYNLTDLYLESSYNKSYTWWASNFWVLSPVFDNSTYSFSWYYVSWWSNLEFTENQTFSWNVFEGFYTQGVRFVVSNYPTILMSMFWVLLVLLVLRTFIRKPRL